VEGARVEAQVLALHAGSRRIVLDHYNRTHRGIPADASTSVS